MKNLFKLGLVALMSVCALGFARAEEEGGDPETLTVTPASNGTVANDVVTFEGIAAFKVKVDGKTGVDSNYQIVVTYYIGDAVEGIESNYAVTDTLVELVGVYNGEYTVAFELKQRKEGNTEWGTVGEAKEFDIKVTGYAEPKSNITFDVKPAKNTTSEGKIIFADGNVAFDILVKGLAENDTNYMVEASIWSRAEVAENNGPQPTQVKITGDSIRYTEGAFYNDEYEAAFELFVYSAGRGEYISVDAIEAVKITFLVTENEAPAADPAISVELVGATKDGDNYVVAPGEAVFNVTLENMEELDTNYYFAMAVCTKAQFEDTAYTVNFEKKDIAKSVKYTKTLEKGDYVAMFELRAPADTIGRDKEDYKVVDGETFFISVRNVANENVELAGVNVYPNPNNGSFNVVVPERARIDIFGLNGAKVMSREANAGVEAFNIDNNGIYFVRVMAGNKTAVKRVVVR